MENDKLCSAGTSKKNIYVYIYIYKIGRTISKKMRMPRVQ
jgi:hypothetical protein